MKKTPILLICALSLSLPGLAAAAGHWGALPSPSVPTQTRPHLPHPGPHARACDLAGVWKWTEGYHLSPDTQSVTLQAYRSRNSSHKSYWIMHSRKVVSGVRESVEYDPRSRQLWVWGYAAPLFEYGSGTLSPDCRHVRIHWHLNSGYGTRDVNESFVRR